MKKTLEDMRADTDYRSLTVTGTPPCPVVASSNYVIQGFEPPPNPFARISEIAARLGVKPCSKCATVCFVGADGQHYDVFEVAAAFLDRMDRQS